MDLFASLDNSLTLFGFCLLYSGRNDLTGFFFCAADLLLRDLFSMIYSRFKRDKRGSCRDNYCEYDDQNKYDYRYSNGKFLLYI